jgi:hypothetical protein
MTELMGRCLSFEPAERPPFAACATALRAALDSLHGSKFGSGGGARSPGAAAAAPQYDVFLSHRQLDAQDFVRHLYDILTAKGYRVFLDRVDASQLHDLPSIVRSSRCVVFVLSTNIFE